MTATETASARRQWRVLLAIAAALLGIGRATNASADPDPVELSVVDRDTGQVLPVWRRHGHLFIAGEPGARYGLRVANHTDGRVLVVMSVDGVNILSGETAGYDQRGYVFQAHQSYDVNGWRKTNTEVAAFTFAPLPQSYAARSGRPSNVGVIGIAVFKEQVAYQAPAVVVPEVMPNRRVEPGRGSPDTPAERRTIAPSAAPLPVPRQSVAAPPAIPPPPLPIPPMPKAPPPSPAPVVVTAAKRAPPATSDFAARPQGEKLGTAQGAREWSVANTVTFVRATSTPQSVQQIEYDSYDNLVASGVIRPIRKAEHRPRPFPSRPDGAGYVPDPPSEP